MAFETSKSDVVAAAALTVSPAAGEGIEAADWAPGRAAVLADQPFNCTSDLRDGASPPPAADTAGSAV